MTIPEADIRKARILIVDDQQSNVVLLEQMLLSAGYSDIMLTMKSQDVCALHRQHDFDLILLDLQMPVMDGFAVIDALKTNERDHFPPVLVITAQPGHKLRALQAGARDFISKPFDLLEIRTRIRNMLELRLLYRHLETHCRELESRVLERTAELRESEARYRSLTKLPSDWYWEQDRDGAFTKVSGPVQEMLGLRVDVLPNAELAEPQDGWNEAQRTQLRIHISQRSPFIDFLFGRVNSDGSKQQFKVSGEPMFNAACDFIGYRGVGVEVFTRK